MPDTPTAPLKHLSFHAQPEHLPFKTGGGGSGKPPFSRDRDAHARYLKSQTDSVERAFVETAEERQQADLSSEFGLILNVASEPGYPLAFTSLENSPRGKTPAIVLLNLRHEETEGGVVTKAAIYVPHGQLKILSNKISAYADHSKGPKDKEGNITGPANAPLLANIASISVAAFEALWTDPEPLPESGASIWFELWIRRDQSNWEPQLLNECENLGISLPEEKLVLPEHIVIVVQSTRSQLESSLDLLNTLSEIRIARPCRVGLSDLSGLEQGEWLEEALNRVHLPPGDAPSVCLIDSGVNRAHPLIEPLLTEQDSETVFSDGDRSDDLRHGTPMAGLAAYGDLRQLMLSTGTWEQLHRLESVKLIRGSTSHEPENYGAVTLRAIDLPSIAAPRRARIFCMAVTAPGPNTRGNPSAWSSAIDMAASGTEAETGIPRVIVISAGNAPEAPANFDYPQALREAPIEDPAQAWNAITVGAITSRTNIEEDDDEARRSIAIAPDHGLSPFSRTAHEWRPDWPIRPDIVMEGGNLAKAPDDSTLHFDSLQPLSSAADFRIRPLTPFNATSAASAQAARIAARISQRYPDYRAETIRGILVHSARWPEELLRREDLDPHTSGKTEKVEELMRSYGYGVVDEDRALESLQNQTTMVTENSIQPLTDGSSAPKLNECHLVALPWPKAILVANPDHTVTLRVTLSYFIHPNPGSRTWEKSQKYHYANCLLRFRPKHRDMPLSEFRSRLDAESQASKDQYQDPGWAVGGTNRGKAGSLVHDIWRGTSAQLAEMGHIGIFPVKGWWAYRKFKEGHELHGCHLNRVNYSLIVSLETDAPLPIYAEVAQAITAIEATASVDVEA
ncbi:MAG: S8 family peptidase [Verrucomicrobiota bacterium]